MEDLLCASASVRPEPSNLRLLRDKLELWRNASQIGHPETRDYNRRAAAELARLITAAEAMREVLDECESYFERFADADCDQDGFVPNEEMTRLNSVRSALTLADFVLADATNNKDPS